MSEKNGSEKGKMLSPEEQKQFDANTLLEKWLRDSRAPNEEELKKYLGQDNHQ